MQPAAQISIAVVWVGELSKSSGARYQRVTTRGVIGLIGSPNRRASPKSAKEMKKTVSQENYTFFYLFYQSWRILDQSLKDWILLNHGGCNSVCEGTRVLGIPKAKAKLFFFIWISKAKKKCHTWRPMHFTWASVNGFGILSSIEAKSCSQYSMTRKTLFQIKHESSYKIAYEIYWLCCTFQDFCQPRPLWWPQYFRADNSTAT